MFSPATRKRHINPPPKDPNLGQPLTTGSPATPLTENRRSSALGTAVPNRPSTGTPAPWTSRLSVLARISPVKEIEKRADTDPVKPVYVGEFPEEVRDAQAGFLRKSAPGEPGISGGIDKETSLSWIICGNQLFVWSYFSSASKNCVILELPSFSEEDDINAPSNRDNVWMVCFVNCSGKSGSAEKVVKKFDSVGVVMCNQKSKAVIYWPDIYSKSMKSVANDHPQPSRMGSRNTNSDESVYFNSLIASPVPVSSHVCIAIASASDGTLWQFHCTPSGIHRKEISTVFTTQSNHSIESGKSQVGKGYPKSLIWRFRLFTPEEFHREFFLLTDTEIHCFRISLSSDINVAMLWSQEIIGTDSDLGIKKDLAGQKRVWPLDMQVDERGKELAILVATFCKDRVSSSSYTQYFLLVMQYKSGLNYFSDNTEPIHERVLEKKAPIQVIIPKARVEDENFLFSMRLRMGGKPSGSTIILSGDGTATVSHYWRNSSRLYQFDLPWDAGKVLDASVFPSTEDSEEGAWVVLTEKAGVWAIPEKAVLLGGVEPPERSLSRKGSSNGRAVEEEKRNLSFGGNVAPRRASSEAWDVGERQRAVSTIIARRAAQDEESEALLGHLFQDFLLSGQVNDSFEKLQDCGAFEKDDETNIFACTSKSIVDTLAKHWTTTRGAEIVAMAVVSSQLLDKQQKHQKFLQFLAFSKCHEELLTRQRRSLQTIMEHGEKLAGIIQLREFQNTHSQNRLNASSNPYPDSRNEKAGSLWDLLQLVGEKARRSAVLLMDRDNAEVFYSKVSELEEVFNCICHHLQAIIRTEEPFVVQVQQACEISDACTTIICAAIQYRNEHHTWYPSPEGLTPWYCQLVVRNGLWCIASFMLQLLRETTDLKVKSNIYSHLESMADVLLEAYTGAITAKLERGEEHEGLSDEYWRRRDELLDSLYQQVKAFVEESYQNSIKDTEEPKEVLLRKFSTSLLSLAKRHEGYLTLWNICCDLDDTSLLRNLMHESVGPNKGFSYFVFKQMYLNRQFAKLLRLGEEFPEEVAIFLKQHKDLMWLHEIFLDQFSSASETLHALALSQGHNDLSSEQGQDPDNLNLEQSLTDRRRLLNLSKIAAMAGSNHVFETKIERIEADLKILKLQDEIIRLVSDVKEKPDIGQSLLPPGELIRLCLEGNTPELSLLAFDVFAWTSSSFRRSNKGLLEECWKNAANQDDWGKLYEASEVQGWSDEKTLEKLKNTVLFQASSRCYGLEAETYEGGFDEALPLRQEDAEPSILKDPGSSVEGILMQLKNFPEAGKLMLTAVMLGKLGVQMAVEADGPRMSMD
ncbi:hypothetical protein Sjap_002827 [Stephania japonica]|uniref:Nuclear pore complex protein NUP133 n=1 Tax=Stephania japonica TaxID=461633 RepID=A0AAP0PSZ3_9MAGN